MKLYLCVTEDEYELPIAVADSKYELAKMLGVTYETVRLCMSRVAQGKSAYSKYKVVDVDDTD